MNIYILPVHYFKKIIARIIQGIRDGRSFSECLGDYPKIFSTLYVTLVHAGEESSSLQEMLVDVATYQRNQNELVSKVKVREDKKLTKLYPGAR